MGQSIRRGFAEASFGQIHFRTAGTGPPILICHASPGSAKQQEPLVNRLAETHRVLAPDTPGNGDSSPLPCDEPSARDFADALLSFLASSGIDHCDIYGTHTGAAIATEMAILQPARIRRLVLDGMTTFTDKQRSEYLQCYAHPFSPDQDGAYLMRVFMFCRDQHLFFPWYARDKEHRRDSGLPAASNIHDWVLEVLKAQSTYHHAYRAAFAYDAAATAPHIKQPTLVVAAEDDPLRAGTEAVAPLLANARFLALPRYDHPDYLDLLVQAITSFFTESR